MNYNCSQYQHYCFFMSHLEINALRHRYAEKPVVDGVGFSVEAGKIACLLGPSGCGKTTILRCIAGFEPVEAGEIRIDGQCVSHPDFLLPPEKRRIGMVFQDHALFPHLTVAGNIAFGLVQGGKGERERRVTELLDATGLSGEGEKYPHELSGGQQQRVALARALAPRPHLMLLDEPFSSLDADLRGRLSGEVRALLKREGATAILVTHDQNEAFAMADEIGLLWQGRLQQWDAPERLYHAPANRFVASFIGEGVFMPARRGPDGRVSLATGERESSRPFVAAGGPFPTDHIAAFLRPEAVVADEESPLRGEIVQQVFRGASARLTLRLPDGAEILSIAPSREYRTVGEWIGVRLDHRKILCFPD